MKTLRNVHCGRCWQSRQTGMRLKHALVGFVAAIMLQGAVASAKPTPRGEGQPIREVKVQIRTGSSNQAVPANIGQRRLLQSRGSNILTSPRDVYRIRGPAAAQGYQDLLLPVLDGIPKETPARSTTHFNERQPSPATQDSDSDQTDQSEMSPWSPLKPRWGESGDSPVLRRTPSIQPYQYKTPQPKNQLKSRGLNLNLEAVDHASSTAKIGGGNPGLSGFMPVRLRLASQQGVRVTRHQNVQVKRVLAELAKQTQQRSENVPTPSDKLNFEPKVPTKDLRIKTQMPQMTHETTKALLDQLLKPQLSFKGTVARLESLPGVGEHLKALPGVGKTVSPRDGMVPSSRPIVSSPRHTQLQQSKVTLQQAHSRQFGYTQQKTLTNKLTTPVNVMRGRMQESNGFFSGRPRPQQQSQNRL